MKKTIFLILVTIAALPALAQQGNHAFVGAGIGSTSSINFGGLHNWAFKKFNLGAGLRAGINMSKDQKYITAPAEFAADAVNHDTLYVKDAHNIIAANLFINASYSITKKLYVGFNIDVFGFSMGGQADSARFKSGDNAGLSEYTDAKATSTNVLLVGNNDLGTLNSNFYVGYQITEKLGIQAGVGLLFTELTAENELGINKVKRYRNKPMQGVFNVTYKF